MSSHQANDPRPALDEAAAAAPAPYLGPRLPRWQSVAAVLSLGTFALLWFLLPSEVPAHRPAVKVAIAPETPAPERPVAPMPVPAPASGRQPLLEQAAPRSPVVPVADLGTRNCRPYSSSMTVLGTRQDVIGLACQAIDGSWQLVSEAPVGR